MSRQIKILLVLHSLNVGGQEVQFVLLAKSLKMMNIDVSIMIFKSGGALESICNKFGIEVVCLNKRDRRGFLIFLFRFASAVRRINPTVIYGGGLLPTLLKPLYWFIPVIWPVRSSGAAVISMPLRSRFYEFLSAKLSFLADAIICNSQKGLNYVKSLGYSTNKIFVIENGVEVECYKYDPSARARTRSAYKLPDNTILFGIVCRVVPIKGHHNLFRAFETLRKAGLNVKLICVGSGLPEYVNTLKQLAVELGLSDSIIWTGQCNNLPEIYSAIDILVSSSLVEGFPNVVLEAMSCGLPVVATDVGDCKRIVGNCGWVVAPENSAALAAAMYEALKSLTHWEPNIGRNRVVDNYSVDVMVNRTLDVFYSLVKSNN